MKSIKDKVAVIGLGYVGLPLAIHFAESGYTVIGLDKDPKKITSLINGISYIPDITDAVLQKKMQDDLFKVATPDNGIEEFRKADYVIVTVPTPLSEAGDPDLGAIISASNYIYKELQQGQTIIFESSTYPGTLEEVVLPILQKSNKIVGKDFFLGYSPERIDPSNQQFPLCKIPKVVSGKTEECKKRVIECYKPCFDKVVPVSSPKIAETCKLFENIQRLVNISLVNEIFLLCKKLDIDFYEAIEAASTKPFGFSAYWPGPGIGGHCIPVDPIYFQWKVNQYGMSSQLIQAAQDINSKMPFEIVNQVKEKITGEHAKVLIIGLAYKKDVNDRRESPSLPIFNLLIQEGYQVNYHDPYFSSISIQNQLYTSVNLSKNQIQKADLVLILTDHSNIDWKLIRQEAKSVIDTRGILRTLREEKYYE